jgi:hypothetical protein
MKAISDEIVAKFRDAAFEFFAPLAEKHGLRFVVTDLTEYSIPMKDLTVRIRLIPSHIPDPVVSVYANDPKWIRESPLGSWGVNLLKFVQYQDANYNFADSKLSSRAELRMKMTLLADLLNKYCETLLRGDSSLWQKVLSCAEEEVFRRSNTLHKGKQ